MLMCDATGLSQRRACRLTGLSLSTCRYEAHRPAADAHLSGRITELALERRRFGYRRIWQLLRREGLHVNHKRVYRLYHLSGLGVKRRRRRKGLATERLPLLRPAAPNLTWSMDFVMDALSTGRRIKCLTCVDDFTKECLTVTVAFGISGVQVTRILDSIALFRGYPATIRTDQGPEFTCRALDQWAFEHGVELRLIQPGKLYRYLLHNLKLMIINHLYEYHLKRITTAATKTTISKKYFMMLFLACGSLFIIFISLTTITSLSFI